MKIGIDIDGVLAHFDGVFIELMVKVTGKDLYPARPVPIPCWDFPQHYGYTNDEVKATFDAVKKDPLFWVGLPAFNDAQGALERLKRRENDGDDIYFLTDRPGIKAKWQTESWLSWRGFPRATVLITKYKGLACKALSIEAYIDDKPSNCQDVTEVCEADVYMLSRSWNVNEKKPRHVTKVTTISEFLDILASPKVNA